MDKGKLQEKLNQPFNSTRWKEVVDFVFPGSQYYAQERKIPSSEEIVERFAQKGVVRLADGKDLALVELHLKKGSVHLPKNRVKLRKLVADMIDQGRAHGVIAVFEQGGKDYRLSFVAKESVIEDGEFKTRETAPKRFTYLLGPGETCRTAAERLYALGQKPDQQLKDVTDAFNVDKLNKQFFKDYQAQYEKFCNFLANPKNGFRKSVFGIPAKADEKAEKPIRDFVKRLLGRLVFLQFLQKKGWMGCPADSKHWKKGDRLFLQSFFAACPDPEHFHSTFLTPLFYDALNRENRENDLFDLSGTRIPYLNGGLFEDDLSATKSIDFPPDYFQGLLEFFGNYNFTIDENDPMDAEVGIDPEMLGHIFENLLEDNKDKGAYYTPKSIVHYMCQESLLQYLKTHLFPNLGKNDDPNFQALEKWIRSSDKTVSDDRGNFVRKNARQIEELLDAVKICDPAIGSGAFPMGLLQEIYRCKMNLDLTLEPAEVKRGIIQNSIYGVDIEKGAVDIARLRFWLSLVVDEEKPSPLPNLDYKIMQGNSLLESFEGVNLKFEVKRARLKIVKEVDLFGKAVDPQDDFIDFLQSASGGDTWDLEQIERVYFEEHDPQKKAEMRKQVDETEKQFILGRLDEKIDDVEDLLARQKKKLAALKNLDPNKDLSKSREGKKFQTLETERARLKTAKEKLAAIQPGEKPYFLWQLYFMDVFKNGGFDIVIGNPPYISIETFARTNFQAVWKKIFKTYASRGDVYCLFYEQGFDLLQDGGILTFISSNKFQRSNYGKGLRQLIANQQIQVLIDFCELPVFAAATDPMIVVATKSETDVHREFPVLVVKDQGEFNYLAQSVECRASRYTPQQLKPEGWSLEGRIGLSLVDKLRAKGTPLIGYINGQLYLGVRTGLNDAFVIDRTTRDTLIRENPCSAELIKLWIRGRDIEQWTHDFHDLYVIIFPHGFHTELKNYPAVRRHLSQFEKRLKSRGQCLSSRSGNSKGQHHWLELDNNPSTAYIEAFETQKIVIADIGKRLKAAWSSPEYFIGNTGYIIANAELFTLAILLGKVTDWYARMTFQSLGDPWKGGRMRFINRNLITIPIPPATPAQKSKIEEWVERILAAKKENPEADVSVLEAEIDQLVYQLYDLTEEEIAIVEGSQPVPTTMKSLLKEVVIPELKQRGSYFSYDDVKLELKKNTEETVPDATLKTYLSEFMDTGFIFDAGKGWYSTLSKRFGLNVSPLSKITKLLSEQFPLLEVSCWSTEQINPYMHHLLSRFTTMVYTSDDALSVVGDALRDAGYDVLVDPKTRDIEQHYTKLDNPVVIRRSKTKEPEAVTGTAPIEKILVDLLWENKRLMFMEQSEAEAVVQKVVESGRINMAALQSYAKRRDTELPV